MRLFDLALGIVTALFVILCPPLLFNHLQYLSTIADLLSNPREPFLSGNYAAEHLFRTDRPRFNKVQVE